MYLPINWHHIKKGIGNLLFLTAMLPFISACLFKTPEKKDNVMNKRQIPLEDFFKNPDKTAFALSPDGKNLAFLAPYKDRKNIFVQTLDDKKPAKRITAVSDRDLSGFFWANNDRLIYVRDFEGDENYHLFSVMSDGSAEKDLTPFPNVRVNIIDILYDDDENIIISMNKRNPQIFDPYRLNIVSGKITLLAENPGNYTGWMTDHNGRLLLAVATDGVNSSLLYRKNENLPFETLLSTNFKESVDPLFFDFEDSTKIYALSNLGRDKSAVVKLDLLSGKEIEKIFEHPDVDVSYMAYSRKRRVPTSISYITWKREFKFLDKTVETLYKRLEEELKDVEIVLSSTNREEDKFIVRSFSDRSLGAYYYYDKNSDKLLKIADVSPWLPENELAKVKPIQFTTSDGLNIQGYLTLPPGKEAKKLPVVVNPHGGPWARDVWTFNPEVQFLANRGYAVLQINFRGSTGYGRKFWEASFGQWGLKMQDDISEAVQWLIKEGIADEKRIAIYGGSYGGYAALAGVTFTPDLYACGIDYVGVSNLFSFMNTIPPYWEPYRKMLYEMVGNPEDREDSLRMHATSPVFHTDKIKVPLLIAQGAKDPRVNKAESDQIVNALKSRNVAVEYILKDNEGHGFQNQENRFEFYGRMEKFLEKHLGK
jgi:dipeptidyl aminopeptidase/acylaminoacyl peptidase